MPAVTFTLNTLPTGGATKILRFEPRDAPWINVDGEVVTPDGFQRSYPRGIAHSEMLDQGAWRVRIGTQWYPFDVPAGGGDLATLIAWDIPAGTPASTLTAAVEAFGTAWLDSYSNAVIDDRVRTVGDATYASSDDPRLSDTRTPTDGSVTAVKMANRAVQNAKIADSAVTPAKLYPSGVTPTAKHYYRGDGIWSVPKQPLLGSLMAQNRGIYPSVDVTSVNVTTTIASSAVFHRWDATSKYRQSGCSLTQSVAGDANQGCRNSITGVSTATLSLTPYAIETTTSAQTVRVYLYTTLVTSDMLIYVDGMKLQPADIVLTSTGQWMVEINFATARVRTIRVVFAGNQNFVALGAPSGIFTAPSPAKRVRCAVVGDSYGQGVSPSNVFAGGFVQRAAARWGWDIYNLSIASSGYKAVAASDATTPYNSPERKAALAAIGNLDVIIFFGTANDQGQSQTDVQAAANAAWTAAKTAYPTATLIVVGVESGLGSTYNTLNSWVIAAAQANTSVDAVLDLRTDAVTYGTGYAGSPTGNGTADLYMSSDNLHMTVAGHEAHEDWLTRRVAAVPMAA